MKCDELKPYTIYEGDVGNYTEHVAYNKQDVDEAIAELKAKLDEYVLVKLSTQQMLQNLLDCGLIKEWYFNGKFNFVLKANDPHLQIKELNAKLKESEEARYKAGAVIAQLNDKARHYPMMALIIEESKRDLLRQAKEILHHKYKRCLAIVETCIYKKELDEDRYHMHGGHGWTNYRFWDKWQKTWLELSEKFKDKEA